MKVYKKWWFWAVIILFIVINLVVNRNQSPAPAGHLPSPGERVGTH